MDYENSPPNWVIKRSKASRKNFLKWYDGSHGHLGYCKNILGVVMTMDRLYSTKDTLYV